MKSGLGRVEPADCCKSFHIRLRFTIRDLLWLTLVVGLIVGWWLDHRSIANRLDGLEMEVRRLGTFMTPQVT
jgi:hypothetical protein